MRTIGNGNIRRAGAGIAYGTGANCKQLQTWMLATNDDAAAVETAGYFNDLADEMKVGDIIEARLDLDGAPALREYIVSGNAAGVVAITLGIATAAV